MTKLPSVFDIESRIGDVRICLVQAKAIVDKAIADEVIVVTLPPAPTATVTVPSACRLTPLPEVYRAEVKPGRWDGDRFVETFDGLTAEECLVRFAAKQQEPVNYTRVVNGEVYKSPPPKYDPLTPLQLSTARSAWSAALRARIAEAKAKERVEVVCERQDEL